jgi:hypothetical protein
MLTDNQRMVCLFKDGHELKGGEASSNFSLRELFRCCLLRMFEAFELALITLPAL